MLLLFFLLAKVVLVIILWRRDQNVKLLKESEQGDELDELRRERRRKDLKNQRTRVKGELSKSKMEKELEVRFEQEKVVDIFDRSFLYCYCSTIVQKNLGVFTRKKIDEENFLIPSPND